MTLNSDIKGAEAEIIVEEQKRAFSRDYREKTLRKVDPMRFMLVMIPNISEEDWAPSEDAVAEMAKYASEMSQAGVLLSLEGLHPTSNGARVSAKDGKVEIVNGPFAEAKEVIGGYWIIDVSSRDEALEWAVRCPAVQGPASVPDYSGPVPIVEVRQIFESWEFPPEIQKAANFGGK